MYKYNFISFKIYIRIYLINHNNRIMVIEDQLLKLNTLTRNHIRMYIDLPMRNKELYIISII